MVYVANATGAGVRPTREVVGAPQLVAKLPVGEAMQDAPPKPAAGEVEVPCHDARVTSLQEEEPAVLPVPVGQVVHELEPATEKVLTPQIMASVEAAGQEKPAVQTFCCAFGKVPVLQKKPAWHGLEMEEELASAKQ